jgi:hypothetical protein
MGKVTDSAQEGFYLRIVYEDSNGWSFFSTAHDVEGASLPVSVVSRDVLYGSKIKEEFDISLTRDYLVKFKTTGFNVRVDGKNGKLFVKFPSKEIGGFLEVLEGVEGQVRSKLLAVPLGDGTRPVLGVRALPVDEKMAQALKLSKPTGVWIVFVTAGSPAEAAGLKIGDVVTEYNGKEVPPTATGLSDFVSASAPRSTAKIGLKRNDDALQLSVTY